MEVIVDSLGTFVVFRSRPLNTFQILGGCLAIVLVCSALFSQGSAGRILGSITDQTGAVIPGVTVTLTNTETGIVHKVQARRRSPLQVADLVIRRIRRNEVGEERHDVKNGQDQQANDAKMVLAKAPPG